MKNCNHLATRLIAPTAGVAALGLALAVSLAHSAQAGEITRPPAPANGKEAFVSYAADYFLYKASYENC